MDLAVAADLDLEPVGEGVHAGDADAVEAAGDLVAAVAELAAGVQDREDDLDGGAVLGGVHVDGDAAAVVAHGAGAVGVERDVDVRAEAGHGLVDRVVDDLVDAVVVAALEGVADVHGGALADGLHALEDLDLAGAVVLVLGDVGGGGEGGVVIRVRQAERSTAIRAGSTAIRALGGGPGRRDWGNGGCVGRIGHGWSFLGGVFEIGPGTECRGLDSIAWFPWRAQARMRALCARSRARQTRMRNRGQNGG